MSSVHDSTPWAWPLREREVVTLAAATTARWLRVDAGCVWITPRRAGAHVADLWLSAGDSLALPPGSEWVVEAWPQARLSLLLAASVSGRRVPGSSGQWQPGRAWAAVRRRASRLLARLSFRPHPHAA